MIPADLASRFMADDSLYEEVYTYEKEEGLNKLGHFTENILRSITCDMVAHTSQGTSIPATEENKQMILNYLKDHGYCNVWVNSRVCDYAFDKSYIVGETYLDWGCEW